MNTRSLLLNAVVLCLVTTFVYADRIEEKYDNGKTKVRYTVNDKKQKDGRFQSFHETGKPKVKATYKNDVLEGPYFEFDENGKPLVRAAYKEGKLHGNFKKYEGRKVVKDVVYINGQVAFPKSQREIQAKFAEIDRMEITINRADEAKGDTTLEERKKGARLHMKYRYLADLDYEIELDGRYNLYSDWSSQIMKRINRITHHPKNPGMPEDEFKLGYKGASQGNLAMGYGSIERSIHGWMDDSDASNIARVGHRRWILNPAMLRSDYGQVGKFGTMYAFDKDRRDYKDYDFTPFPSRGYHPQSMFKNHYGWSITLNSRKFNKPDKGIKVSITPVQISRGKVREAKPLELNYFNVDNSGIGKDRNVIVFRPKDFNVLDNHIYRVEVTGLKPRNDEVTNKITYYVQFYRDR